MEGNKSKVYVLVDSQNRITRCEGGYTMGNISDLSQWVCIDAGNGDKYNLCQSHYFNGGLYTEDGIPRYKLVSGNPVLRSDAEIHADPAELAPDVPNEDDKPVTWGELYAAYAEGVFSA